MKITKVQTVCDQCSKPEDLSTSKDYLNFSTISLDDSDNEIHFCSEQCAVKWIRKQYQKGKPHPGCPR